MKTAQEMLHEAQEMLQLTQKDFGVYAGVSARTVNSWFTGDRKCPDHVAELILRIAISDVSAIGEDDEPTSTMWRWAWIDAAGIDMDITPYGSKVDAMRAAEQYWQRMTKHDKGRRTTYQVGLMKFELTEDGLQPEDPDVYDIAKDWLSTDD